jgi:hypothetical protein
MGVDAVQLSPATAPGTDVIGCDAFAGNDPGAAAIVVAILFPTQVQEAFNRRIVDDIHQNNEQNPRHSKRKALSESTWKQPSD